MPRRRPHLSLGSPGRNRRAKGHQALTGNVIGGKHAHGIILPNGGKEVAKDHFILRLMRDPNDWQTGFEFKEMLQASLVLRGNGYAPMVRDGCGGPLTMVSVHPDRAGLFEAPSGGYFYAVTRNGCTRWRCCASSRC